jgi:hypothetical protein
MYTQSEINELLNNFHKFAADGDYKTVEELLKIKEVKAQAAEYNNDALQMAADKGHLEVVKLLLDIPAVKENAAAWNNRALRLAASNGHLEVVKLLLDIPAVKEDAAAWNNQALRLATDQGHLELVKLLLDIPAVKENAAVENNRLLRLAVDRGHLEVVKVLIKVDSVFSRILSNPDSYSENLVTQATEAAINKIDYYSKEQHNATAQDYKTFIGFFDKIKNRDKIKNKIEQTAEAKIHERYFLTQAEEFSDEIRNSTEEDYIEFEEWFSSKQNDLLHSQKTGLVHAETKENARVKLYGDYFFKQIQNLQNPMNSELFKGRRRLLNKEVVDFFETLPKIQNSTAATSALYRMSELQKAVQNMQQDLPASRPRSK